MRTKSRERLFLFAAVQRKHIEKEKRRKRTIVFC